MLTKNSVIAAAEDLTAADLDGEAVILDIKSGRYYGLNEVGARIFNLVRHPRPVEEVLGIITQEYQVGAEQAQADLFAFLQEMEEKQLIREMQTALQEPQQVGV